MLLNLVTFCIYCGIKIYKRFIKLSWCEVPEFVSVVQSCLHDDQSVIFYTLFII